MAVDKQKQDDLAYGTNHEVEEVRFDTIIGVYDSTDDNDEANKINISEHLDSFEKEQSFQNINDESFNFMEV